MDNDVVAQAENKFSRIKFVNHYEPEVSYGGKLLRAVSHSNLKPSFKHVLLELGGALTFDDIEEARWLSKYDLMKLTSYSDKPLRLILKQLISQGYVLQDCKQSKRDSKGKQATLRFRLSEKILVEYQATLADGRNNHLLTITSDKNGTNRKIKSDGRNNHLITATDGRNNHLVSNNDATDGRNNRGADGRNNRDYVFIDPKRISNTDCLIANSEPTVSQSEPKNQSINQGGQNAIEASEGENRTGIMATELSRAYAASMGRDLTETQLIKLLGRLEDCPFNLDELRRRIVILAEDPFTRVSFRSINQIFMFPDALLQGSKVRDRIMGFIAGDKKLGKKIDEQYFRALAKLTRGGPNDFPLDLPRFLAWAKQEMPEAFSQKSSLRLVSQSGAESGNSPSGVLN